jgi:hypothetical protein
MLLKTVLFAALFADAVLLLDLLAGFVGMPWIDWLALHCLCSLITAKAYWLLTDRGATSLAFEHRPAQNRLSYDSLNDKATRNPVYYLDRVCTNAIGRYVLVGLTTLLVPGVGGPAMLAALSPYAKNLLSRQSQKAADVQITRWTDLLINTPSAGRVNALDRRAVTEHFVYSSDDTDLYRKVLGASDIRASLAVDSRRQALRHTDERIRLTASESLRSEAARLQHAVRELNAKLDTCAEDQRSDIWLQLAGNCWELMLLEGSESDAANTWLAKAGEAACQSLDAKPANRHAHYMLGRVSLAQAKTQRAAAALKQAQELGMPSEKTLPYLAECAFIERDFHRVKQLLARLDKTLVSNSPLSQLAQFWA